jgi:hypothetical protein
MSDKILLANIERLLKAKKVSADALCKAAGTPDAIRNLRRRTAGEKTGSWKLDTLEAIAAALDTVPWELLRPPGAGTARDQDIREIVREVVAEEMADQHAPKRRAKNIR